MCFLCAWYCSYSRTVSNLEQCLTIGLNWELAFQLFSADGSFVKLSIIANQAFLVVSPRMQKYLPDDMALAESLSGFRQRPRTYLFTKSFFLTFSDLTGLHICHISTWPSSSLSYFGHFSSHHHHHHRQPWAQHPLVSDAIVTIAAHRCLSRAAWLRILTAMHLCSLSSICCQLAQYHLQLHYFDVAIQYYKEALIHTENDFQVIWLNLHIIW